MSYLIDGEADWLEGINAEGLPQKCPHLWPHDDRVIICYGDLELHQKLIDSRNASIRTAWEDPARRAKQGETVRAAYAARSSESLKAHRAKHAAAIKKAYADPELRQRISEQKKAWWAERKLKASMQLASSQGQHC